MKITLCFAALVIGLAGTLGAKDYYAAPDGSASGEGTRESPWLLTKARLNQIASADRLVLLSGTYKMGETLARNGAIVLCGETGEPRDVVLDFQGKYQGIRTAGGFVIHSLTVSNAVYGTGATDSIAGVRVGGGGTDANINVLSNAVVTCCSPSSGKVSGGVYVKWNGLLVDTLVENCTATDVGGVLCESTPHVEGAFVRRCTVTGCTGTTAGGGAYGYWEDCVVSNNVSTATEGGAVGGLYNPFVVRHCEVVGNTAVAKGGGAYFSSDSIVTANGVLPCFLVTNSLFRLNAATNGSYGGGVYCNFPTSTKPVEVVDTLFVSNSCYYSGGGLYANNTALVCRRTAFTGNDTSWRHTGGAGCYATATGTGSLLLSECAFTNNVGVGLQVGNVNAVVTNCEFVGNTAASGAGVALAAVGNETSISGCTFIDNLAYGTSADGDGFGGAVAFMPNATSGTVTGRIERCQFFGNVATNATVSEKGCGGAVGSRYGTSGAVWSIENCSFVGNASYSGGAVSFGTLNDNVTLTGGHIYNCVFSNNTAFAGGALLFRSTGTETDPGVTVRNCLFAFNTGAFEAGAVYYVNQQLATMENCTFLSNRLCRAAGTQTSGAAIYHKWAGIVRNSIFDGNIVVKGGVEAKDTSNWGLGAAYIQNCVCWPEMNTAYFTAANGSYTEAPRLRLCTDRFGAAYLPARSSRAFRGGAVQDWMGVATDLRGAPRLQNGAVSLGCFEYAPFTGFLFLMF